jgi:hypothetical protein
MRPFLIDAWWLTAGSGAVTAVIAAATRLLFRRGKGLEEL